MGYFPACLYAKDREKVLEIGTVGRRFGAFELISGVRVS